MSKLPLMITGTPYSEQRHLTFHSGTASFLARSILGRRRDAEPLDPSSSFRCCICFTFTASCGTEEDISQLPPSGVSVYDGFTFLSLSHTIYLSYLSMPATTDIER
ncbi:unnamed protein product, partial [Musa acuminata var. zebrina]